MDKESFAEQIEALSERLYRVAWTILRHNEDCRDVLQESVLKAWVCRHKLRNEEHFATWITRIVINECHNAQQRQIRQCQAIAGAKEALQNAAVEDPALSESLFSLPEKYRLPMVLHYVEGYSTKEVAQILRVPESTVRGRLYQTRKTLRTAYMGEERFS